VTIIAESDLSDSGPRLRPRLGFRLARVTIGPARTQSGPGYPRPVVGGHYRPGLRLSGTCLSRRWLVVTIVPDSGPGYWPSSGWWSLSALTQALATGYHMAGGHYRPGLRPWLSYLWWSLSSRTQALAAILWLVVTIGPARRTQALAILWPVVTVPWWSQN